MKFITTLILTLFTSISFAQVPSPPAAVTASFAYSQGVGPVIVGRSNSYGIDISVTNMSPAPGTFTCAVTNICTFTNHGFLTGLVVQASTTSALPAGLVTSTNYYIIPLTANTFSFASSLANAKIGTAVTITDTGTGVQTVTPTALAGASVKLQGSMDGVIWADLPIKATGDATKSATIAATGVIHLEDVTLSSNWIRPYYTLASGQLSISQVSKSRNLLQQY